MPISFSCPDCQRKLKAPDHLAGRAVRCPQCKQALRVPAAEPLEDMALSVLAEEAQPSPAPAAPPPAPAIPKPPTPAVAAASATAPPPSPRARPAVKPFAALQGPPAPGGWLYWLFALTLIPLGFSLLGGPDDTEDRLLRTLDNHPEIAARIEGDANFTPEKLFAALPDGKIEGAHLAHATYVHWLYALVAATAFFGLLAALFSRGNAELTHLLGVALATATAGILFLLCVQWIAAATQGWFPRGRGIAILLFLIIKFIGFSYHAALDPENGFLLSFVGFTCGVGFCEEFTKMLPLVFHFRSKATLDWRGACIWGLASGIGFGVAEGVLYSSQHYNGLAGGGTYLVRFISCVGLHAIWAGAAGIALWRRKEWLQNDEWDWGDLLATFVWVLSVPMVLHGLYDTLLKKEMYGWALLTALVSFVWLVVLTEYTRSEERDFDAAESRRRRRRAAATV